MTLEKRKPGTLGSEGLGKPGPLAFSPSHPVQRRCEPRLRWVLCAGRSGEKINELTGRIAPHQDSRTA
jgi:hypothetical protein